MSTVAQAGWRRRFPPRGMLVVAAGAVALGSVVGVAIHLALGSTHPAGALALPALNGQAVWPAGERSAPRFTLGDQNGRLVSLAAERGHTVVLAFLDPGCRKRCALEATGLALAEDEVPAAERGVLLVVSLDSHATRAQAQAAARRWGFGGDWHWLVGADDQLEAVWRAYGVGVGVSRGSLAADSAVYVIDAHGFERVGVHAPFLPQFLADDLRALAPAGG